MGRGLEPISAVYRPRQGWGYGTLLKGNSSVLWRGAGAATNTPSNCNRGLTWELSASPWFLTCGVTATDVLLLNILDKNPSGFYSAAGEILVRFWRQLWHHDFYNLTSLIMLLLNEIKQLDTWHNRGSCRRFWDRTFINLGLVLCTR